MSQVVFRRNVALQGRAGAWWRRVCAIGALVCVLPLQAQTGAAVVAGPGAAGAPAVGLNQWLDRLQDASRRRSYIGTFVVSAGSTMSASKIWHVCDGTQQMERIESLTGKPRTILRRNDEVLTLVPESRVACAR